MKANLLMVIVGSVITDFHDKKMQKESTMQVFINNNARFCY